MKLKDSVKEQRIIEQTIEIVYQKGLSGLKMTALANAVKISPSNLYIYFKNKEDLLRQVFFTSIERLVGRVQAMNQQIEASELPYKKQVFEFFKEGIRLKSMNMRELIFFQRFIRSPYIKPADHEILESYSQEIFRILILGREQMILKDQVDFWVLIALVEGTTDKLVEMHSNGKIQLDDQMISQGFELIWDAIRQ